MYRNDRGFSTVELLIVIVLMGILAAMAAPKLSTVASSLALGAARQEVAAALATARAAAIQNGRPVSFVRSGNTVGVFMDSAGTTVTLGSVRDLGTLHGVEVTASRNVIRYDARGLATGLDPVEAFVVSRGGERDSVCVLRLGKVSTKECTP